MQFIFYGIYRTFSKSTGHIVKEHAIFINIYTLPIPGPRDSYPLTFWQKNEFRAEVLKSCYFTGNISFWNRTLTRTLTGTIQYDGLKTLCQNRVKMNNLDTHSPTHQPTYPPPTHPIPHTTPPTSPSKIRIKNNFANANLFCDYRRKSN